MQGFRIYAWSLSNTKSHRLDLSALDCAARSAADDPRAQSSLHSSMRFAHPHAASEHIVRRPEAELMRNVFLGAGLRLARYVPNESSRRDDQGVRRPAFCRAAACFSCSRREPALCACPSTSLVGSVETTIAKHAAVPCRGQTLINETDSPFKSKGWPAFSAMTQSPHRCTGAFGAGGSNRRRMPWHSPWRRLSEYYRRELEGAQQSRRIERD